MQADCCWVARGYGWVTIGGLTMLETGRIVSSINLNHCSTVRMTASLAEKLFRTATTITAAELSERHLDMLQMVDIDWSTREALGPAEDAIRAGNRRAPAVQMCVAAYNARCGR